MAQCTRDQSLAADADMAKQVQVVRYASLDQIRNKHNGLFSDIRSHDDRGPADRERAMTQERIAGFLIGIGLGTVLGFFLRKADDENRDRELDTTQHRHSPGKPSIGLEPELSPAPAD